MEIYNKVGGWLLLFCIILTIINPLITLYNFGTNYDQVSILIERYPALQNLMYIDTLLSILITILSIRAGIALWNIKPRAISMSKNYLLIYLGYSFFTMLMPFVVGLPSEFSKVMFPELLKGALKALIFFGIWYSYLKISQRVEATYRVYARSDNDSTLEIKDELEKSDSV